MAPGPARWRRAWDAGLRPRARWLWPAVVCGLLAAALAEGPPDPRAWGLDVRPGAVTPSQWLGHTVQRLASLALVAGAVVVLVALVSRRLGGISTAARRRLRAAPASPAAWGSMAVAGLVGMGVVLALVGVLAGAARSVDASPAGLVTLWWGWAARGLAVLAVGLGLAAVIELWLDHRSRGHRLHRSPHQVREDARASGAR